jgi:hypothetical protein
VINAFAADEYEQLGEMFLPFKSKLGLWLAGHIHRRHNYSFSARNRTINLLDVAETASNKEYEFGKFLVVNVFESPVFTSISQNPLTEIKSIFPNPARDYLLVNLDKKMKNTSINIIDMEGKVVRNMKYDEIAIGQLKIDLVNLVNGFYFIEIKNDIGNYVQTFEKF